MKNQAIVMIPCSTGASTLPWASVGLIISLNVETHAMLINSIKELLEMDNSEGVVRLSWLHHIHVFEKHMTQMTSIQPHSFPNIDCGESNECQKFCSAFSTFLKPRFAAVMQNLLTSAHSSFLAVDSSPKKKSSVAGCKAD